MYFYERICLSIRHSPVLAQADWLWKRVRPLYDATIRLLAPNGLRRVINGTDMVRLLPRWRGIPERYEPDVWRQFMEAVRVGDIIADAGAFIGLYAIPAATRAGESGKVIAFEPDVSNREALAAHVRLNGLEKRVTIWAAAVSDTDGKMPFLGDGTCESRICAHDRAHSTRSVRLDSVFPAPQRVDILKIDVEGLEERVLDGGADLLRDRYRRPRLMFIEMHPQLWEFSGTTSDSVLGKLRQLGYRVKTLDGQPANVIMEYSNVVATTEELEHEIR